MEQEKQEMSAQESPTIGHVFRRVYGRIVGIEVLTTILVALVISGLLLGAGVSSLVLEVKHQQVPAHQGCLRQSSQLAWASAFFC